MAESQRDRPPAETGGADRHHGNSVAAWTMVVVMLVGCLVMAVGVGVTTLWVFLTGAGVVALGGLLGKILSAMGFGVAGRPQD